MNKDFEKGSILEFNAIGTIVVIGNIEKEGNLYILACPLKKRNDEAIEADLRKMFLLKKESDNEIYTETDSKVIEDIVPKILKKEKIDLQ